MTRQGPNGCGSPYNCACAHTLVPSCKHCSNIHPSGGVSLTSACEGTRCVCTALPCSRIQGGNTLSQCAAEACVCVCVSSEHAIAIAHMHIALCASTFLRGCDMAQAPESSRNSERLLDPVEWRLVITMLQSRDLASLFIITLLRHILPPTLQPIPFSQWGRNGIRLKIHQSH